MGQLRILGGLVQGFHDATIRHPETIAIANSGDTASMVMLYQIGAKIKLFLIRQ